MPETRQQRNAKTLWRYHNDENYRQRQLTLAKAWHARHPTYRQSYYETHIERLKAYSVDYRAKNRDKAREYGRKYRANNRERCRLACRRWYYRHRERILAEKRSLTRKQA